LVALDLAAVHKTLERDLSPWAMCQ